MKILGISGSAFGRFGSNKSGINTQKPKKKAQIDQKMCFLPKPIATHGYKSATTDIESIEKWFTRAPMLNIGIACAPSNLVVFDIDYRNGGTTEGFNLDTFTVATGDGLHLYYTAPADAKFKGKLREGVDIKHNGYVVGAGSLHESGKFYEVVKDIQPAPMMEWI